MILFYIIYYETNKILKHNFIFKKKKKKKTLWKYIININASKRGKSTI